MTTVDANLDEPVPEPPVAKKAVAKKATAKRVAKKAVAKKSAATRPAKKSAVKKSAAKSPVKKAAVKKSVAKKSVAKKSVAKKTVATRPAKKAAVKKSVTKRAVRASTMTAPSETGVPTARVEAQMAGREEAAAIAAYLDALDSQPRRGRGRPRTIESVRQQLAKAEAELARPRSSLAKVTAIQNRLRLREELDALESVDAQQRTLADGFAERVATYSERKGITWTAWREAGVPAEVLTRGGMTDPDTLERAVPDAAPKRRRRKGRRRTKG